MNTASLLQETRSIYDSMKDTFHCLVDYNQKLTWCTVSKNKLTPKEVTSIDVNPHCHSCKNSPVISVKAFLPVVFLDKNNRIFKKLIIFWNVHGIMNSSGLLQSKGFTLILQDTRSIHDSMNIPKIEFIAYIYILS